LTGLFLGMAMMPAVRQAARQPKSYEKKIAMVGLALLAVMWIILGSCLYFADDYPLYYSGAL
jgi:ABC-type Co2+ transport system permease subunit